VCLVETATRLIHCTARLMQLICLVCLISRVLAITTFNALTPPNADHANMTVSLSPVEIAVEILFPAWVPKRPGSPRFTDADFEGFQKSPSGLKYKVIEEGDGAKPQKGQTIKVHYAGFLLSGFKFDSSYGSSPLEIQVGVGMLIKGFDEALLDMQVGEKRMLRIPYNLAYGESGYRAMIPPKMPLVLFVELVTLAA